MFTNSSVHVLHLNDYCTLKSCYPSLAIEAGDKIALVNVSRFQSIFVRDEKSSDGTYRYVLPPFDCYGGRADILVVDGPMIRIIQTSRAEITRNDENKLQILVPSMLVKINDDSTVTYVKTPPKPFEKFGLNLPCYVAYTRDSSVVFLQDELKDNLSDDLKSHLQDNLLIWPINSSNSVGAHAVYGRDGFGLFQMGRFNSQYSGNRIRFHLYNSSLGKKFNEDRYAFMIGYSDKDTKIMVTDNHLEQTKLSPIQLPGIQSPPFFFIAKGGSVAYFGPLITPLCGYLDYGCLFVLGEDKEFHLIYPYKKDMKSMYGTHFYMYPINIVRGSDVVATYVLASYIEGVSTSALEIYRFNRDNFSLEEVRTLKNITWLNDEDHAPLIIAQDAYYIHYKTRPKLKGEPREYSILALTENGVHDLNMNDNMKEILPDLGHLKQFWPNPSVAALYTDDKSMVIYRSHKTTDGADIVSATVDIDAEYTSWSPFFCVGNKLYIIEKGGEEVDGGKEIRQKNGTTEVCFINPYARKSDKNIETIRARLLWSGEDFKK